MTRTPPAKVRRQLRQEVGFHCPVADCGNPYLTWHHFDPPWRLEQHHRPEGMMALCLNHAARADVGAFTDDQLRTLKREGRSRAEDVRGRFDWLRQDLLVVVGGNFFYESPIIFQINERPCIWLNRNDDGFLQVNFDMPSITDQPRARIRDNDWIVPPDAADVVCPPSGRMLDIRYPNDDRLRIEFFNVDTSDSLSTRYASVPAPLLSTLTFPSTGVEIYEKVSGTIIEFGPRSSQIATNQISGSFFKRSGGAAIRLDVSPSDFSRLHLDAEEQE